MGNRPKLEVYSDGSATTKDRPGGYGYVLVLDGDKIAEGSGSSPGATNNDMELEGAIQGLLAAVRHIPIEMLVTRPEVELVSDSQIVLGWASGTYRFKQVDKLEKYEQLMRLVKAMKVKTRWVEGHSGNEHNERCDQLANKARKEFISENEDFVSSDSTRNYSSFDTVSMLRES